MAHYLVNITHYVVLVNQAAANNKSGAIKMAKRLEQLKKKREQLNAQIQKVEATGRTKERKQETRRKILVGAYFLNKAREDGAMENLTQQVDAYLTRNIDRVLFGLPAVDKGNKGTGSQSRRNADANGSVAGENVE